MNRTCVCMGDSHSVPQHFCQQALRKSGHLHTDLLHTANSRPSSQLLFSPEVVSSKAQTSGYRLQTTPTSYKLLMNEWLGVGWTSLVSPGAPGPGAATEGHGVATSKSSSRTPPHGANTSNDLLHAENLRLKAILRRNLRREDATIGLMRAAEAAQRFMDQAYDEEIWSDGDES